MTELPGAVKLELVASEEVRVKMQEWRAKIIDDVVKHGLKSSAQIAKEGGEFFSSADGSPNEFIEGVTLYPPSAPNPYEYEFSLHDKLYSALPVRGRIIDKTGAHSVFPVLVERDYDEPKWQVEFMRSGKIYGARANASFLVVTAGGDRRNVRKKGVIKQESFIYLLIPETIWREYLVKNPFAEQEIKTPVIVIKELVNKTLLRSRSGNKVALVPDYEQALKRILVERQKPIWVHGVRLPTEYDVLAEMEEERGE